MLQTIPRIRVDERKKFLDNVLAARKLLRTARLDGVAYEQLYQQLMVNVIQFRAHFLFFSHCIIFLGYGMGKIRAHTREKSLKTYRKEIQQVCVEKLSLGL